MESINEALKQLNEQENISVDEIDEFKRDENGYITVYIVSSNKNNDDIEEQFLDKDSAISYAKKNLEYETWVDKVVFNPDTDEEKVETIWSYDNDALREDLNEPTRFVWKYGKNIKAIDYFRNLKAAADDIIDDYVDFVFDRESFNNYNVDMFEFYNDLVDELRNRGYGLSSVIIDHSKDEVGKEDLFNYKYTVTLLNEALNKKEMEDEEKRRLAQEIGLDTMDALKRFRKDVKKPFESDLDALRRYRKELGDDFKINEEIIERDKVYKFHRIPTWSGQFNFPTERKLTLDQLEAEAKDQATYKPHIWGNKETSEYVIVVAYSNIASSWISDIIYSNSPNEINNMRDALSDVDSNSDIYIESIDLRTGESTVINIIPNIRYHNNKPIENIGDRVIYEKVDAIHKVLNNKKRKKIEETTKTKEVVVDTIDIGDELIIPNNENKELEKWFVKDVIQRNPQSGYLTVVLENESGNKKKLDLDINDKVKIKENLNLNEPINESIHDVATVVSDSYNHFTKGLGRTPSIVDILNDITNNYDGYDDIQDTPELTEKWYQTIASELNRQGLKFTTDESLNEDYIAYETSDDLERIFKAYNECKDVLIKKELEKALRIALYQTYKNEGVDMKRWEEIRKTI